MQLQQPDITRLASSSKLDMYEGARGAPPDPPNYHAAASHQLPGTAHLAGTSQHHVGGSGLLQQLLSPSSDNIFRPIQQSYMIQTSPHQQAYLGSRDRNLAGQYIVVVLSNSDSNSYGGSCCSNKG